MSGVIGKIGFGVDEPSSFIAHVILAPNLDRMDYVNYCLKTGSVLIKSVDNQIEKSVQISKSCIHLIRFPTQAEKLGSPVICIKDPLYRTSKIVGVIQEDPDEQFIFEENEWRISKKGSDNFADIGIKGNTGEFSLTTQSKDSVKSFFKFLNKNKKAKVDFIVQGDYILSTDKSITLKTNNILDLLVKDNTVKNSKLTRIRYEAGKGFAYLDEFENQLNLNKDSIEVKRKNGETIKLSNQGFTLKTKNEDLKKILLDTLSMVNDLMVTTYVGPGFTSPTTKAQIQQLNLRINNLFE